MTTLTTVLVYGLLTSLLLSAFILMTARINPRLMLRSYPKDVQAAVPPPTEREKRLTLVLAVPFWLIFVGFPIAAALAVKASHQGFLLMFLSTFGVMLLANMVDWLILNWLIFCTLTPKFAVLPGTAGLAGYKNYAMHFRRFVIWTAVAVIVSLLLAGLIGVV